MGCRQALGVEGCDVDNRKVPPGDHMMVEPSSDWSCSAKMGNTMEAIRVVVEQYAREINL
jgi:hypothetical protein